MLSLSNDVEDVGSTESVVSEFDEDKSTEPVVETEVWLSERDVSLTVSELEDVRSRESVDWLDASVDSNVSVDELGPSETVAEDVRSSKSDDELGTSVSV